MPKRQEVDAPGIVVLMPTRGRPTIETLVSMGSMDGLPSLVMPCPRKGVVEARNELADGVLNVPARAPWTPKMGWYVLWADDDAFWAPGTMRRMVTAMQSPGVDILVGWFTGRSKHGPPYATRQDGTHPIPGTGPDCDCEDGDVVEIFKAGFHFVMHRIDVLKKLGPNPFSLKDTSEKGEDYAFFERARQAGLRTWVHTGCPIAHVDDDGVCYLPGLGPLRVIGSNLVKATDPRDYGEEVVA